MWRHAEVGFVYILLDDVWLMSSDGTTNLSLDNVYFDDTLN